MSHVNMRDVIAKTTNWNRQAVGELAAAAGQVIDRGENLDLRNLADKIKSTPSIRHTQAGLDALEQLVERGVEDKSIAPLWAGTYASFGSLLALAGAQLVFPVASIPVALGLVPMAALFAGAVRSFEVASSQPD